MFLCVVFLPCMAVVTGVRAKFPHGLGYNLKVSAPTKPRYSAKWHKEENYNLKYQRNIFYILYNFFPKELNPFVYDIKKKNVLVVTADFHYQYLEMQLFYPQESVGEAAAQ